MTSSKPRCHPKALPPNTITSGVRTSTYGFKGTWTVVRKAEMSLTILLANKFPCLPHFPSSASHQVLSIVPSRSSLIKPHDTPELIQTFSFLKWTAPVTPTCLLSPILPPFNPFVIIYNMQMRFCHLLAIWGLPSLLWWNLQLLPLLTWKTSSLGVAWALGSVCVCVCVCACTCVRVHLWVCVCAWDSWSHTDRSPQIYPFFALCAHEIIYGH